MTVLKFGRSEADLVFRRHTKRLIDSAQREIYVITGEASAYRYLDLKYAAQRAAGRGVKIQIYATDVPQSLINGFLKLGCDVYVGRERPEDHYLVVDSYSWMVSKSHRPGEIGVRDGEVHEGDLSGAKAKISYFYQLKNREDTEKQEKIDWKHDPLWLALQKPFDWKVPTDSSRLEEEF